MEISLYRSLTYYFVKAELKKGKRTNSLSILIQDTLLYFPIYLCFTFHGRYILGPEMHHQNLNPKEHPLLEFTLIRSLP